MKVAVGTITAPTSAGGANQTSVVDLSTLGFSASEPLRAVKLFTAYRTGTGAADGDIRWCNGFLTNDGGSIQQAYHTAFSLDGAATDDTGRGMNTTAVLKGFSAATALVTEYTATATTVTTTGFTLTWSTAPASAIIVGYIAFGGSDTTARVGSFLNTTAAATQNVTVNTGFGQPDLVFTSGSMITTLGDLAGAMNFALAAFTKAGAARSTYVVENRGQTTMRMGHRQYAGASDYTADQASIAFPAATSTPSASGSWPTDGFQLTYSATPSTARQTIYLAIKTTSPVTLGSASSPTATSLTQSLSHGTNTPQAALFWGGLLPTNAAAVTAATDLGGWFMGAYDGTTQLVHGTCQMNAAADGSCGRWYDNTKAVQFYAPIAPAASPPTLKSQASAAVVGTGIDLTYSAFDSLAREFNYLLIGAGSSSTSKSDSDSGTSTGAGAPAATLPGSDSGTGTDAGTVAIAGSDSGTETDAGAVPSATLPGSDTGTRTETGAVAASASGADSATGTDAGAPAATLPGSDTGSGTDTGALQAQPPGSDSGAGTDASSPPPASLPGSQTGTGTEAGAPAATLPGSDSGTGTDAGTPAATLPGSDSATVAESSSTQATLPSADSGTATDAGAPSNTPAGADSATASETGSTSAALSSSDAASVTEGGTVTTGAQPAGSDSGAGTEGASTAVTLSSADTGSGTDTGSLALTGSDSGAGTDASSVTSPVAGTDTGAGTETGTITASPSGSDSGTGTDLDFVEAPRSSADTATATEGSSVAATVPSSDGSQGGGGGVIGDFDLALSHEASAIVVIPDFVPPPIVDDDDGGGFVDETSIYGDTRHIVSGDSARFFELSSARDVTVAPAPSPRVVRRPAPSAPVAAPAPPALAPVAPPAPVPEPRVIERVVERTVIEHVGLTMADVQTIVDARVEAIRDELRQEMRRELDLLRDEMEAHIALVLADA